METALDFKKCIIAVRRHRHEPDHLQTASPSTQQSIVSVKTYIYLFHSRCMSPRWRVDALRLPDELVRTSLAAPEQPPALGAALGRCLCVAGQQKPVSTCTEHSMPMDDWKSLTHNKDALRERETQGKRKGLVVNVKAQPSPAARTTDTWFSCALLPRSASLSQPAPSTAGLLRQWRKHL